MEKNESKNVFKVYNKIANWFAENKCVDLIEQNYLEALISEIKSNANVLDIGCGTGKPILEYLLNKNLNIIGVDASKEMLTIARNNFPTTEFVLEDMRKLALNKKFDAIIAWHSFFHLPAADQPKMFEIFESHINPKGILLFTSGSERGEAWGINGGENLFHASLNTDEYQQLLKKHNFEVLNHIVNDENCGGATVWMAKYNP
ncbi:class I SAM-dependent methyltransferase [Pedobacter aquatilis]|uniref:class I SAM-dependent DNA methyltransferase n=1 Tax=Pedobacter aquatilis TaxID=351343 RepID=UPI00292DC653|nr:class I SAM-dependent methyltransferase [Pedobacter aquatilis]